MVKRITHRHLSNPAIAHEAEPFEETFRTVMQRHTSLRIAAGHMLGMRLHNAFARWPRSQPAPPPTLPAPHVAAGFHLR